MKVKIPNCIEKDCKNKSHNGVKCLLHLYHESVESNDYLRAKMTEYQESEKDLRAQAEFINHQIGKFKDLSEFYRGKSEAYEKILVPTKPKEDRD